MSTTRLVLLGVVRIFQPAYGYQLRRELISWRVDRWANVHPGSVYSGLKTLERQGFLTQATSSGRPDRTAYRLTADGDDEYFALLREALWHVPDFSGSEMVGALNFMWSLSRDEVIAALESRISQFENGAKASRFTQQQVLESPGTPDQVVETFRLVGARQSGELGWTRDLLERIRGGAYSFAGEGEPWRPPPGTPTQWSAASASSPDPERRTPRVRRDQHAARRTAKRTAHDRDHGAGGTTKDQS